jgi:hypothetical protein
MSGIFQFAISRDSAHTFDLFFPLPAKVNIGAATRDLRYDDDADADDLRILLMRH